MMQPNLGLIPLIILVMFENIASIILDDEQSNSKQYGNQFPPYFPTSAPKIRMSTTTPHYDNRFVKNTNISAESENSENENKMVVDAFLKYGVVPQIIPSPPKEILYIKAGEKETSLGEFVPAFNLAFIPFSIYWPSDSHTMYTLILLNADNNYVLYQSRELLNFGMLVVNIPGNNLDVGDTLVNYKSGLPYPGYGLQRYVGLVYEQNEKINPSLELMINVSTTDKVNLLEFLRIHKLGDPIYGNFLTTSLVFCNDLETESCL